MKIGTTYFRDVDCTEKNGRLLVEFRKWPESTVVVQLSSNDAGAFAVSYPAVQKNRKGDLTSEDEYHDGALETAVLWIVKKVAKHGHVPGEFM